MEKAGGKSRRLRQALRLGQPQALRSVRHWLRQALRLGQPQALRSVLRLRQPLRPGLLQTAGCGPKPKSPPKTERKSQ